MYCPKATFQKSTGVQSRGDKQAEVVPSSSPQPCVACSALLCSGCAMLCFTAAHDAEELQRQWKGLAAVNWVKWSPGTGKLWSVLIGVGGLHLVYYKMLGACAFMNPKKISSLWVQMLAVLWFPGVQRPFLQQWHYCCGKDDACVPPQTCPSPSYGSLLKSKWLFTFWQVELIPIFPLWLSTVAQRAGCPN